MKLLRINRKIVVLASLFFIFLSIWYLLRPETPSFFQSDFKNVDRVILCIKNTDGFIESELDRTQAGIFYNILQDFDDSWFRNDYVTSPANDFSVEVHYADNTVVYISFGESWLSAEGYYSIMSKVAFRRVIVALDLVE